LTPKETRHFAGIIHRNRYDREGAKIAFLDAESTQVDRIRNNLKLSPEARIQRHSSLVDQLKKARRVQS
jgi:hypothetical protein